MQNEHIEYFKRFSASYFRWTKFNFARIAADAVRRDAEIEAKRKEEARSLPYREAMAKLFANSEAELKLMNEAAMKDAAFFGGTQWLTHYDDEGNIHFKSLTAEEYFERV